MDSAATAEYQTLSGCNTTSVPLQPVNAANDPHHHHPDSSSTNIITVPGHWDDTCLLNEIMTDSFHGDSSSGSSTARAISSITLAALEDLGYTVDYNQTDAFTLEDNLNSSCTCQENLQQPPSEPPAEAAVAGAAIKAALSAAPVPADSSPPSPPSPPLHHKLQGGIRTIMNAPGDVSNKGQEQEQPKQQQSQRRKQQQQHQRQLSDHGRQVAIKYGKEILMDRKARIGNKYPIDPKPDGNNIVYVGSHVVSVLYRENNVVYSIQLIDPDV